MEKKILYFKEIKNKKERKKIPSLSHFNNVSAHEIDNFTAAVLPLVHEASMSSAVSIV